MEKYVVPGFAEPLNPLRPEKEILIRYKAAERRLNKSFPAVIELQSSEEEKGEFQKYQRLWLKARDSGAEAFAAFGSKEQRRCRKLQYLADAIENRARDLEKFFENHQKDDRLLCLQPILKKCVLECGLKWTGIAVADSELRTDFELCDAMDFQIEFAALRHGSAYRLQRECRRVAIPAEVSKQNTLDFSRQQCLDHACGRCVRQMTVP